MQNPLEITFHNLDHSPAIEKVIQEKFEKVKQISPDITKCHVIIEKLSNHHQTANTSCARLDLKAPHFKDIIVSEKCSEDPAELMKSVIKIFKRGKTLLREEANRRRAHKKTPSLDELTAGEETESDEIDETVI